jgi:hypothetical protein
VFEVAVAALGQISAEFRSPLTLPEQVFEGLPKDQCRDKTIILLANTFKAASGTA